MQDVIQEFLKYLSDTKGYSLNTIDAYEMDVLDFLKFFNKFNGADADVADLSRADTICFRAYLADRQRRGLAYKSTARALSSLRGFYKFLGRKYDIKNDAIGLVFAKGATQIVQGDKRVGCCRYAGCDSCDKCKKSVGCGA